MIHKYILLAVFASCTWGWGADTASILLEGETLWKALKLSRPAARIATDKLAAFRVDAKGKTALYQQKLNCNAEKIKQLIVTAKVEKAGQLRLAADLTDNGKKRSVRLFRKVGPDRDFQEYSFSLGDQANWKGHLTNYELRWFGSDGDVIIKSIRTSDHVRRSFSGRELFGKVHLFKAEAVPSADALLAEIGTVPGGFYQSKLTWPTEEIKIMRFSLMSKVAGRIRLACACKQDDKKFNIVFPPQTVPGDGQYHDYIFALTGKKNWKGVMTNYELRWLGKPAGIGLKSVSAESTGLNSRTWVFNNTNAGWNSTRNLISTITPEGLKLDLTGPNSGIEINGLELTTPGADFMRIEYTASGIPAVTRGQLYFATETNSTLNEIAKFAIGSLEGDGKDRVLYINLHSGRGCKLWENARYITRLRLNLVNQFPGKITIKNIRLVDSESYWKEQDGKYAHLGIPSRIRSEIPATGVNTTSPKQDDNAARFSSPMTAPAGSFSYQGCNYLRTEFMLDSIPRKNLLQSICDDQISALYLNGNRIDNQWSGYFRTMDILEIPRKYFKTGKNVLCIAYENKAGLGGLMLDLQMVLPNGEYRVVTPAQGSGTTEKPGDDWIKPDYKCDWKKVETRPGPPAAPWINMIPDYLSIKPLNGKVEISLRPLSGCDVEAVFRSSSSFAENEKFYGKFTTTGGTLIKSISGTLRELGGKVMPDGSVVIRFSPYPMPLYGVSQKGRWTFGIYGRSSEGNYSIKVSSPERIVPGEPAVLKLSQTAAGPVPMLNGKPFYFNILTCHQYKQQFSVPSGMEGKNSPFNVVAVRAGGSSETNWWIGPDKYDFAAVDRYLSRLMFLYPDSKLGVYVWCQPPHWYEKRYPDRIYKAHDGTKRGYYVSTVTFSDPEVRADAQRALTALVKHCEKYFGSRIVLYNLLGGISCEWQGWHIGTNKFADFGVNAKRDFIRYAAARGVTVTKVPDAKARMLSDGGIFRNPKRDALAMLYDDYYNESVAECIRGIAEAVKKACSGNKLVGCYYGYLLEFANLAHGINGSGHNDIARLLNSPDIDFFLSPNGYGIRSLGMPNGDMKPFASIRAAGKLSMLEDDTRTHLTPPAGFDQTVTLEHTLNILKRNVGMYLAHKMPLNQLPLAGGNELDAPEIRDMFTKTVAAGQYLMEKGLDPTAEIAAVVDANSCKYLAAVKNIQGIKGAGAFCYNYKGEIMELGRAVQVLTGELLSYQRESLGQIGAPVDIILLEDVKKLASKYKLVIFLNAFEDSKELEQAFAALRKHKTAAIITYGAGFIDSNGFSTSAMSKLANMTVARTAPGRLKINWGAGTHFGSDYEVNPRFAVEDASAKVLGKYSDNGAVAVAEKGNVLFYGAATLDTEFLRGYARKKGVHIYCDTRENLCAGGSIVSINARSARRKTIRLPRPCRVEDIYSGEVISEKTSEFTLDMKAFETRVFLCK